MSHFRGTPAKSGLGGYTGNNWRVAALGIRGSSAGVPRVRHGGVMEATSPRSGRWHGHWWPGLRASRQRNDIPRDRAPAFFAYVATVAIGAIAGVVLGVGHVPSVHHDNPGFWVIAALAVIVDIRPFHAPGQEPEATVFTSIAFTFALLLGWGLGPAVAVQSAAVVVSSVGLRHAPWRAVFNAGQYALAFCASALVPGLFHRTVPLSPELSPVVSSVTVTAILVAAVAWFVVNEALVITALQLAFGGRWLPALTTSLRRELLSTLSLLALSPLVAAAGIVNALFVPLMLIPLYAVYELARYSDRERRKALRDDLTDLPNRRSLLGEMRRQVRRF